ncbi:hypothetical protein ABT218_11590 [Streptomyces sp. NPDC001455]|uniref:hypothetical protein n=1 Tax=unclassified Streptomyces TaxID=2593676 RepID=UPI00331FB2D3
MNTTPSPLGAAESVAASPFGDQWWQGPGALHVNGVKLLHAEVDADGAARRGGHRTARRLRLIPGSCGGHRRR